MLEIRPCCEHCGKSLPPAATDAMVCSYECTFCKDCVDNVLLNVCPNCGGGFEKRPIRNREKLLKDPPTTKAIFKPVDMEQYRPLQERYKGINPEDR